MSDAKQIFISYSRRDGNTQAERLERELRAKGFHVWRDVRDIDPAKDFTADIERGIEESAQVVVCVTPDSKRDDSFVRREIQYALLSQKPVIPVRFAEIKPHLPIINYEWIDIFRDWDDRFARLCAILMGEAREFQQRQISDDPFRPYLETLYKRVVSFLGQAVIKLIDLTSEATPDAVNAPSRRKDMIDLFFEAQGIGGELPSDPKPFHTFAEAFEYYEGRVLLLGEPGAGKTITLFATARDAAARRLNDPTAPLPLLGMISTWDAEKQLSLADWLASGYPELDRELVNEIIFKGHALFLLDGLDELGESRREILSLASFQSSLGREYDPRKRFIEQIPVNNSIIVTCRVKEYHEIGEKVSFSGALTLHPLGEMQMRVYLSEQPELWVAVQRDGALLEMLKTPLLLSFFAFAYQGMTSEEREQLADLSKSPGDLRDKIFETYIRRRYRWEERKRNANLPYEFSKMLDVLKQIAGLDAMQLFGENVIPLRVIEQVLDQSPNLFIEQMINLHIIIPKYHMSHFGFVHTYVRNFFAFQYLTDALADKTWIIRGAAASALGHLQDVRATSLLINLLVDESEQVRRSAAEALGRIGAERAVVPLAKALFDDHNLVAYSAMNALTRIGESSIDALYAVIQRNIDPASSMACQALGQIGEPAITTLIAVMSNGSSHLKVVAADRLRIIGEAIFVPLVEALEKMDSEGKIHATNLLVHLRNPIAQSYLIALLNDSSILVQASAADAIALQAEVFHDNLELLGAMYSSQTNVRYRVLRILRRICDIEDPKYIELIKEVLNDPDPLIRSEALYAFASTNHPEAIEIMSKLLEDEEWKVRRNAIWAMTQRAGSFAGLERIVFFLNYPKAEVRAAAAFVLGHKADGAFQIPLINALHDSDWRVRRSAALSLRSQMYDQAIMPLIGLLNDEYSIVAYTAAWSLVMIGSRAAVPVAKLIFSGDSNNQYLAAGILVNVADRWATEVLVDEFLIATHSIQLRVIKLLQEVEGVDLLISILYAVDTSFQNFVLEALRRINNQKAMEGIQKWQDNFSENKDTITDFDNTISDFESDEWEVSSDGLE